MTAPTPSPAPPGTPDQATLQTALARVLRPLAELAIAHGLPYAVADELLRRAYVEAAREAQPGLPAHGLVSRVSTATGLSRREVARLVQHAGTPTGPRRWPAGEVVTRWLSDPALKPARGQQRRLPRRGPAPSFEVLAQSVTRDVHPRSLLEELCRLGMARIDEATDTVELQCNALVPSDDFGRMVGFLGENVGDHFAAAVENSAGDGTRHHEQAVYADRLSSHSLQVMRTIVTEQWQAVFERLVPAFEALIAADRSAGRTRDQRMRVGLYTYSTDAAPPDEGRAPDDAPAGAPTR